MLHLKGDEIERCFSRLSKRLLPLKLGIHTFRCVWLWSEELIRVSDHASDKLEAVLEVEAVCFLERVNVRRMWSTPLTFKGNRWKEIANWVMSGAESSIMECCGFWRFSGLWLLGNDLWCKYWCAADCVAKFWLLPLHVPRWWGGPNKLLLDRELCRRVEGDCDMLDEVWVGHRLGVAVVDGVTSDSVGVLRIESDAERCKPLVIEFERSS